MRILFLLFVAVSLYLESAAQTTVEIRQDNLRVLLQSDGQFAGQSQAPWMAYQEEDQVVRLAEFSQLVLVGLQDDGSLYSSNGGINRPLDQIRKPAYPKVWQVTAQEVADHIADFEDNGAIDSPISAVFAWPGQWNPFFSDYNDGLVLPEDGGFTAEYWDIDGDGVYNPANGDYPILGIRGCGVPIVPTQMSWAAFELRGMESDTVVFEGSVNLFTFGCQEDNALNDAVFSVHKIKNRSTTTFQDMYWGTFTDPDIGCPDNDYVGSFPDRLSSFIYNATPEDSPCPSLTEEMTFGDNPLAWGMDVYRGPIAEMGTAAPFSAITYYNQAQEGILPATTAPVTVAETYNYLQGKWRDGSLLTVGGNGYGGEEATSFAFPGFPEQEGGWTEWEAENAPGDRQLVHAYGPFDYLPGAVNEFIAAYTVFDGEGDHLEKVSGLRGQIDQLQAYFDACFEVEGPGSPPCMQVFTSTDAPKRTEMPVTVFPNPATDLIYIDAPLIPSQLILLDQLGRVVRQGDSSPLQVSGLPGGVYYLQMQVGQQRLVKKVVLQP